jgi:hypothetical protein
MAIRITTTASTSYETAVWVRETQWKSPEGASEMVDRLEEPWLGNELAQSAKRLISKKAGVSNPCRNQHGLAPDSHC